MRAQSSLIGGQGSGMFSYGTMDDSRNASMWGRRTRMEKMLILLFLAIIGVLFVLTICFISLELIGYQWHGTGPCIISEDICLSAECTKAASSIINNMDKSVDPCHDFYYFACGSFIKNTIIPEDKASVSQFNLIDDRLSSQLKTLVEEKINREDTQSVRNVKNLYSSCMDLEQLEKIGLDPLREYLRQLGGWPVLEENWDEKPFVWYESLYKLRDLGLDTDLLWDFTLPSDFKNSSWRILQIDQPELGMPRKYLLKGFDDKDVQAYYSYMIDYALLLGANETKARMEMKAVLEFEITLSNFTVPMEERRIISKLYNKMLLKDFAKQFPGIPWLNIINKELFPVLSVAEDEPIVAASPTYLANLSLILPTTEKKTLANYFMWRITSSVGGMLNDAARKINQKFLKAFTGQAVETPRWKECMQALVARFFDQAAKEEAMDMVKRIRDSFKELLSKVDWMDPITKQRALEKAEAITDHIAYPNELLNDVALNGLYANLTLAPDEFLKNQIRVTSHFRNYKLRRFREKVDKNDWVAHSNAVAVNAFYSSLENSIQFPAGILQGTFFHKDRPRYLNYGSIGFVIGHEITHGFDDTGRQFDRLGNLDDWWAKETEESFLNRTQCIIWQYGNYSSQELNISLNGINTQGENIADNGGMKEAYAAYRKWVEEHGPEKKLPGLLEYSPHQLFWLALANVWCSNHTPEKLKINILTGVHSPSQFRVIGAMSNSEEFAADFQCPLGSRMNPVNKCSVW